MVACHEEKPKYYQAVFCDPPKVERGPCPRNREIYHAVKFERVSLRKAAEKYELSPTRIQQIVRLVEDWICRTGGGPTRTWQERTRLAEYVYRERTDLDRAAAEAAYYDGFETRTETYVIRDNKVHDRKVILKNTQFNPRFLESANKIAAARQKFEDARPAPPDVKNMTVEERIREARLITAEEMELIRQQLEREQETPAEKTDFASAPLYPGHEYEDPDEQVCNPPAAEEDAERYDEASPSMTTDQRPMTNDPLPPGTSGTQTAAGRLQTCPTAPEPEPEPERLVYYDPPYGPDGVTQLAKWPSPELLDLFWRPDGRGGWDWYPPRIFSTPPGSVSYHWIMPKPPFQDGPCAGRKPRPR